MSKFFHWKRRDTILFLERLELYVSSGLAIDQALKISEEGITPRQRSDIINLRKSVENGGSLSSGLVTFVGLKETVTGLIRQGESSGALGRSLLTAKNLMEREDELLKRCTSAMAYPIIIGVFSCLLTLGLVRGVLPQIIPMLLSLHVKLPFLTRAVIFLSENLTKYGLYSVIFVIVFIVLLKVAYKRLNLVKKFIHRALVGIPLIGRLVYNYSLAVFLFSFGALVESGMSIEKAYSESVSTVSLQVLRGILQKEIPNVSKGHHIGTLINNKRNPPYVSPLLNAGEASGTLGNCLIRAAMITDREIEHSLKKLTTLIEPVMMVGMGGVVGSIALSIMLPIYDISKVLQK